MDIDHVPALQLMHAVWSDAATVDDHVPPKQLMQELLDIAAVVDDQVPELHVEHTEAP